MKNNFENNYKELEEIINKLQNENLDIDQAIIEFKKGVDLHKKCKEILNEAQKEVDQILVDNKELQEYVTNE